MEYRLFGRTGMRVSVLGLGCGGFGGVGSAPELFGKGEDQKTAFALMDRALEAGINYFDTANSYGGGASETMIGLWLAERKVRDQLVISTKVRNRMGDGPNDAGLSRRHIMQQIDASLRRLRTDHVDLYVIHEPDLETPIEETLRAFDDLVRAGKVRYIGASNMPAWRLVKSLWVSDRLNLARFQSIQNSYSLLDRSSEPEVFPLCAEEGLAFTPYSPTSGGFLTGKYGQGKPPPSGSRLTLRPEPYAHLMNAKTFRSIDALAAAAAERGLETVTLALSWVISHPQVTAALIGPRTLDQYRPLLPSVDLRLSPKERDEIAARMEAA
jgi:aryl-alcohol dehydrogenase-like predicted oxidoreductase